MSDMDGGEILEIMRVLGGMISLGILIVLLVMAWIRSEG